VEEVAERLEGTKVHDASFPMGYENGVALEVDGTVVSRDRSPAHETTRERISVDVFRKPEERSGYVPSGRPTQ